MIIKPGDILIVGVDRPVLTQEQAVRIKEMWREKLPGLKDVLIMVGVPTLAVYREESEEQ